MKVKDRLSLQFTFLFAALLLMVLTGIYLYVENNRVNTFFTKLDDRAMTVAQFYLAEDNLSKENFKGILEKFPQALSNEFIRIYDDQYRPKFIPEKTVHWKKEILKEVLEKKQIHFIQQQRQVAGIYYKDNSGNFIIMVSAKDNSGYHNMDELRLIMVAFFLLSLIVTFFIGRIFSRFALFPIISITQNLKRIRASSLDLRLPFDQKKTDEIDSLSLTINHLLEHLQQSFEGQRSFIAHASHELRTPITTILGEAEIALRHDRNIQEYKATLNNIVQETELLSYIINSLMELIQTNVENNDFQSIRIDELMWEIKDELSNKPNENLVTIKYSLPSDPARFILQGNRRLLFIAINNILKNSLKFSNNKEVYCELFCNAKGVNILIRDQGIGILPNDIKNIFQPFFRSSNAVGYPGYGIGLSLTQNILRLHNGIIEVKSQIGKGTEFLIILPV